MKIGRSVGSACTFDHIPEARVTSTDEQKEETKANINVRGQAPWAYNIDSLILLLQVRVIRGEAKRQMSGRSCSLPELLPGERKETLIVENWGIYLIHFIFSSFLPSFSLFLPSFFILSFLTSSLPPSLVPSFLLFPFLWRYSCNYYGSYTGD